jgi:hypothetical protein
MSSPCAEFDRRIKQSLASRRLAGRNQAELLRTQGHNAIRPFFILAPVFNSQLGHFLIRLMKLLPYDDWNIVYLPLDRDPSRDGRRPRSSMPVDQSDRRADARADWWLFHSVQDAKRKVDAHIERSAFKLPWT